MGLTDVFCQEWHFSFLCPLSKSISSTEGSPSYTAKTSVAKAKPSAKEEKEKCETQNGMAVLSMSADSNIVNSILPTFSCHLRDGRCIRGLKDSGNQVSFISEKFLRDNPYRIIQDDLRLVVNGFSNSKTYSSKFELDIQFGNHFHNVKAMCIPEVNVKLNLPGLSKIVNHFIECGYVLTDECFTGDIDFIANIDFILGSDSEECILGETKTFEYEHPSLYYITDWGILLVGNV